MTRAQIENVVWMATVMTLDLDPEATATQSAVRISWPLSDSGNPNWGRNENVVFIRLAPYNDDYSSLWDLSHADNNGEYVETVANHEAYEVTWVCYGSEALEYAQKIRYGLGRDNIRAYLNAQSMAFKPVILQPVYMPEQDRSGAWWERHDVRAQMYVRHVRQYSEGFIDTTPNISIETNNGVDSAFIDVGGGDVAPATGIDLNFNDVGEGNIVITVAD